MEIEYEILGFHELASNSDFIGGTAADYDRCSLSYARNISKSLAWRSGNSNTRGSMSEITKCFFPTWSSCEELYVY
ncbi:hypothetical protein EVAR_67917_1 [Eumeta japonica]|uniref:Uncharacterized protein n=1 Tax=Eumeta variegata TaxID=151549 RepID=A0A4C2A9J6_EUMVA|nr:hypothetical protein EVAR_67917_1 [Eumeta japonica]